MKNIKYLGLFLFGLLFGYLFKYQSSQKVIAELTEQIRISSLENSNEKKTDPPCPCLFSEELLPAPEFDPSIKNTLETNAYGEVIVKWIELAGAKRYVITVENENNKVIKTVKTPRSKIYLKEIPLPEGLLKANYHVRLASMNGNDVVGPAGPARPLLVRSQAPITAPKLEEIKVED